MVHQVHQGTPGTPGTRTPGTAVLVLTRTVPRSQYHSAVPYCIYILGTT
jgi:hypothetical protein